jgi:hypothetical protein
MIQLKQGDTDGPVHFHMRLGKEPAPLAGRTIQARISPIASNSSIPSHTITLIPITDGLASWQPTAADYLALPPGEYHIEVTLTVTADPTAKRIIPTIGYDRLRIHLSLT